MTPIIGILASSGTSSFLGSYESIQTVSVTTATQANIEFTNIPSNYTHLQIRGIAQTNRGTFNTDSIGMRLNGDTASNYSFHDLYSDPASPSTSVIAGGTANTSFVQVNISVSSGVATNTFGVAVIDILDYKNTNKHKVIRQLSGADTNGAASGFAGYVALGSGSWRNTNAVTSITLQPRFGTAFNQYTTFALYGIRG